MCTPLRYGPTVLGETLAVDFHTVVEPPQSQSGSSSTNKNTNTLYAEFYRPLVARLRQRGVWPVGKGGWRGRWRSFQTGHSGANYGTGLDKGRAQVFLSLNGTGHRQRYRALLRHQEEIAGSVDGSVLWQEGNKGAWESLVVLERDMAVSLTGPEEDLETVRRWMADNLVALRDAVQPHLDHVMEAARRGEEIADT